MLAPERVALVLLAAGRSLRFGAADKLAAELLGRPIALHVVTALEAVPFVARIAVTCDTQVDFGAHGYRVIANRDPEAGQARSLRLGVAAARECQPDAILLTLADMPRVTALHIYRLLDAFDARHDVVASSDGHQPMPPALIGAAHFDTLEQQQGDHGARDLIRGGRHVIASGGELVDIDTPEDLAAITPHVTRDGARRSD